MKQMKHKVLTLAALLLASAHLWAGEVIIKTSPANSGSVVSSMSQDGSTCTLTATPAAGYFLTVDNLTAVTTLNGGAVQAPRRSDIEVKSQTVTITAVNANADPSGVTTYTFTMPEDQNLDVEVTADFQELLAIKPVVTLQGWTYGEEAHMPVVTGNTGNGAVTFTYAVKGAQDFSADVPVNAGEYTVKASIAAANKYAAGEATADFTISKAALTLSFENGSVSAYLSDLLYQQQVTASADDNQTYTWSSSDENVATVYEFGLVQMNAIGSATITATTQGTANYNGASASYVITVESDYSIKVNGIMVTSANHADILGDGGSVFYDTNSKLVLTNASIASIELMPTNVLPGDKLTITLVGDNTVTATQDREGILNSGRMVGLILTTNGSDPGTLTYQLPAAVESAETAFGAFSPVTTENNLMIVLDGNVVTVKPTLNPIVNGKTVGGKTTAINYSDDTPVNVLPLTNTVIDNILYTLRDLQRTEEADDGFMFTSSGKGVVVLNSLVSNEDLQTILDLIPGSKQYAERFKGMTFSLPPGSGIISLTSSQAEGHALCVKIGDNDPIVLSHLESLTDVILYAVSKATYVRIYHQLLSSTDNAPRRIGPKTSVSTSMSGLTVSANVIDTPPTPTTDYKKLTASELMSEADFGDGKGLTVSDNTITDLDDDVFSALRSASAPRRAGGMADVPFIDLRATRITGMTVDRQKEVFRQIPENTFIYLPSGNKSASTNVIIGSVCEDLQLKADNEETFQAVADFTAMNATFDRVFTEGEGKSFTVFLPFGIRTDRAKGTFFKYAGFNASTNTVNLTPVADEVLEANTPYIFTPSATAAMEKMMAVEVEATTPATEVEGLNGVYKYHKWTSEPDDIYCYSATDTEKFKAGQFAKVGAGTFIKPFRAYLRISGLASAPQYLAINWGDGQTSIVPLDRDNVQQDAEGWYTITGFRLPAKPAEKGIYIHNHKKTVVK